MKTLTLLGTTMGFAFTAGLNLYATVLVIGTAARMGWIVLPDHLAGLALLGHPLVLAVAAIMYVVEFLADKVPAVDHAWDVVHTGIRPLGAAWVAWRAVGGAGLPEPAEVALILVAGGVAFSTHAGKAGTRLAAASVGGHVFGIGLLLSVVEDVVAFGAAVLTLVQPLLVLVLVILVLTAIALAVPRLVRLFRGRGTAPRVAGE